MACPQGKKNVSSFRKVLNVYDKGWDNYEKGVDWVFDKMRKGAQKIDPKGIWLVATDLQHDVADMITSFNAHKSEIYKTAGDLKSYLDEFDEGESAKLIQALNGDLDKSNLSGDTLGAYTYVRQMIDKNADDLVAVGALSEKNKIKDYIKRYYEKYKDEQGQVKKFFNDKKFSRKDLTYEERILMGMIEDASYVVPRTLLEQKMQLLKANFFKQLDEKFGLESKKDDSYVLVEKIELSSGVYKYGALSGKYVPQQIKDMLDDAHILKEQLGFMEKSLFPVVDHVKVNMTVKNPVTHIYNIVSNLQVSAIQGSLTNVGHILNMIKNDRAALNALLKEVEPFGLDSMLNDLEHVELVSDHKGVNVAKTLMGNIYLSQNSKLGKGLRKVYDWEDKLFKLAAYDHAKKAKMKKLGRELSEDEKLEVYKEAAAPYANYSTPLPKAVKMIDKSGVSPFMHYIYKSTPAVAKLIAKHPVKFGMIQVLLAETGASIFGDEDEALKPDWAGGTSFLSSKINLFGAKDWAGVPFMGGGMYWNAGRMMPGIKFGAIDTTGGFWGGAFRIMSGESPLGYKIDNKYDEMPTKIAKRIMALAENYMPPMSFGRYGQRAVKKIAGQEVKNYYKEDMGWGEIGSRMIGVRRFNESDEVAKKIRAAKRKLAHFKKEDPKNIAEHSKEYKARIKDIYAQARKKGVVATQPKKRAKKIFKSPISQNLVNFKIM